MYCTYSSIVTNANLHMKWGETALHLAASFGKTGALSILLATGGDPHALDNVGTFVLICAAIE